MDFCGDTEIFQLKAQINQHSMTVIDTRRKSESAAIFPSETRLSRGLLQMGRHFLSVVASLKVMRFLHRHPHVQRAEGNIRETTGGPLKCIIILNRKTFQQIWARGQSHGRPRPSRGS